MVWWGRKQARSFSRLLIAILAGRLVSWLGVAALVALSVALPHNPVPRVLRQIDLFCVPQLTDAGCLEAHHNGGSRASRSS
jgi:hypothetical protein